MTDKNAPDITAPMGPLAYFLDLHPAAGDFRADVIEGLRAPQKTISPMYFYDERGSQLFNDITELDEYYVTRTEKELFAQHGEAIVDAIHPGTSIFEYGAGSLDKIKWLIDGAADVVSYIAMDISRDHLIASATALAEATAAPVAAICADFHAPVTLPADILPAPDHYLGYFPGSTLGNMSIEAARAFLTRAAKTLGPGQQFLLGVDLEKDITVLESAYNDAKGVTAAFNLNLLRRMKRELDAEIDMDAFEHHAFYNTHEARIEMHLRAVMDTQIRIGEEVFPFAAGETIHSENSHKFSTARLEKLIEPTPWHMVNAWTDAKNWHGAYLLSNS
ncbi:MAG: L-histidine N(alpha)-methyltransferase [Pseudomonadota bacterium]